MSSKDAKDFDWEKVNTRGLGFKTLSDPDFYQKILENNKNTSADNPQPAQTSQKSTTQVNASKPTQTSTPRFGNTFDLQDTWKEC